MTQYFVVLKNIEQLCDIFGCFTINIALYTAISLFHVIGLGYGLTFTPCSTIISFYFEKKRALANGITVSASGIGAIAFSVLYK